MEPFLGIIGIIVLIGICAIIDYNKKLKKKRTEIKKEKNASLFISLSHYNGLPIAENVFTQIFSCPNEYEFLANNTSFKLDKSKVTDISITSDVEIQKS